MEADLHRWIKFGPLPALAVGSVGFLCALLLERLGKQSLHRRFGPSLGEHHEAILEDARILTRGRRLLRGSAMLGAVLGWIGGAAILAYLFTTRPQHKPPISHSAPKKKDSPAHRKAH